VTIVAAIDFSPVTRAALDALVWLAGPGERIVLLHVAEPDPTFVGLDAGSEAVRETWREELRKEHSRLDAYAEEMRRRGLDGVEPDMVRGAIAEEILRTAEQVGARVIVLGSHGHSRLYRVLVGSVAEHVIRHATIPVLLVPSGPASAAG